MTPPAVPSLPFTLPFDQLTSRRERRYFPWVVLISLLLWAALAMTVVGLFYGVLIGFFLWLGHGLLAAYLRAEGVRVDERQLPALAATYQAVCRELGVTQVPGLYVVQQGGLLNAFAMRHAGRDFVVVYSDMLEALGPDSAEMKFILGHELGHIRSRHPLKHALLAPGMFFPLLGPAYRRAWETSCDRYGAYAAKDVTAAVRTMMILSGGPRFGAQLDAAAYAGQHTDERGFFVSLHELTSLYPTLSRRVVDLRAVAAGTEARSPSRHPLAYPFALLMPGGAAAGGGAAGALMMVFIIGLLAAMAIPAFAKVRESAIEKTCLNNRRVIGAVLAQYQLETGQPPQTFDEVVGEGKYLATMPICPTGGEYSAHPGEGEYDSFVGVCSVHGAGTVMPHRSSY